MAGRPGADARSGGDDRGRAFSLAEADGSERALRLSAARRIPGAHGRLPAASEGRDEAEHAGAGLAVPTPLTLSDGAEFLRASDQHDAAAGADPLIGEEAPDEVREAAAGLRHISVRCVNIGVGRENLTEKHWIYYPEDTVFHRIFVQGNASPHCNPPGGFGLTCEITYSPHKPLPCDGDELIRRCIEDATRSASSAGRSGLDADQVDMPHAYVVYDHGREARWHDPGVAGGARHRPGGPLQRVGVLQLRSRLPRGEEGGGGGAARAGEKMLSRLAAWQGEPMAVSGD